MSAVLITQAGDNEMAPRRKSHTNKFTTIIFLVSSHQMWHFELNHSSEIVVGSWLLCGIVIFVPANQLCKTSIHRKGWTDDVSLTLSFLNKKQKSQKQQTLVKFSHFGAFWHVNYHIIRKGQLISVDLYIWILWNTACVRAVNIIYVLKQTLVKIRCSDCLQLAAISAISVWRVLC